MSEDGDKYKLDIVDAKVADEGEYKVKLVNSLGEDMKSAKLSVSRKFPKIKSRV